MSRTNEPNASVQGFGQSLNTLWPGLRYLGLGLYLAWMLLISDTCSWISDIDAEGGAISNGDLLIRMSSSMNLASAIVLIVAFFGKDFTDRFIRSRATTPLIGVLGAIGAFCIICSGPYFFLGPFALNIVGLFSVGAFICGITSALLILKCALSYGRTDPYRVLVYCLLSEILVSLVYSVVICNDFYRPYEGGPPLSGMVALAILPLLSSFLSSLGPTNDGKDASEQPSEHQPRETRQSIGLFIVTLCVLSIAVAISLGYCASNLGIPAIQTSMRICAMLRLALALILICLAAWKLKRIPLASTCIIAATLIAVALAMFPMLETDGMSMFIIVNAASSLFDLAIWCLLSFIASKRRMPCIEMFCLGYGAVMLGRGLGWYATLDVMPLISESNADIAIYVALAILALILVMRMFSGRHFELLFSAEAEKEFSLQSEEGLKNVIETVEPTRKNRPWKRACKAVCDQAGLSPRERDIFELLSTGYTAEAIADILSISPNTVRTHVHNIYGKLEIHSRQELIDMIRKNAQS